MKLAVNNNSAINTKEKVLRSFFGFDSFRENQEKIIDEILNGNNVLSIMPTGSGKSLCYQIPAILASGITIVISPLISLMQDQILKLKNVSANCTFINSTLSEEEYLKTKKEILQGEYQIIYVAPERLQSKDFIYMTSKLNISLVVVDEAHCVSQWGNDFRKSYLDINNFVNSINPKPVLAAFTATATKAVQEDIISMLGLGDCSVIKSSFDRPNLYIAKHLISNKDKDKFIIDYINDNKDKFGIIYCSTRDNVDKLYELLVSNNVSVGKYHAGMEDIDRKQNQKNFIFDKIKVIVATNAFGMGIDKPNVNYVIHYNCPKDIESYYQEIGRAGRDGTSADCILLYNKEDFKISKFLIKVTYKEEKRRIDADLNKALSVYNNKLDKLDKMITLCYSNECIKKYILNYFGENKIEKCDNCSNCREKIFENRDVTDECNKILKIIQEFDSKYGMYILSSTLKGAKTKKISRLGLDKSISYGTLKSFNVSYVHELFDELIFQGYIYKTKGKYPKLGISEIGINQLNDLNKKIFISEFIPNKKEKNKKTPINSDLLLKLKELRLELARKENVPTYIVFNDRTLENMCELLPTSKEEFLNVIGVGDFKANKYGDYFISAINKYIDKYDK